MCMSVFLFVGMCVCVCVRIVPHHFLRIAEAYSLCLFPSTVTATETRSETFIVG